MQDVGIRERAGAACSIYVNLYVYARLYILYLRHLCRFIQSKSSKCRGSSTAEAAGENF